MQNYRRVTAHINLPNDAAVAFHKKMGFHEVSETDGVLLMERAIEPKTRTQSASRKPTSS